MIASAAIAGLAGAWIWVVLNDEDGLFGFIPRSVAGIPWLAKWLHCPWCSGAWFSGGIALALHHPSAVEALATAVAAAAITGIIGSYFQGD